MRIKLPLLTLIAVIAALAAYPLIAWAQQEMLMTGQDTSGNTRTVRVDANGNLSAVPVTCNILSPHKVTVVGATAVAVPSTAQSGRYWMSACNSAQNTSGVLAKCRADGVTPVFAAANAGDVLAVGDCVTYSVSAERTVMCVASTAGVDVQSYECYSP